MPPEKTAWSSKDNRSKLLVIGQLLTVTVNLEKSRYRLNNAKTKEKGILEHKEASIHGTYSAKDLHIALPANFALQEDYLDNVNWIAVNKT